MRKHGKLGNDVLPFWTVFQGDITRDPCRVREITFWYDGYPNHFFMWRNTTDEKPLISHFNKKLRNLLD
jgi:Type II restriction enzyme MunI.